MRRPVLALIPAFGICCTPDTNLKDVAKLMAEHDCGDISVVERFRHRRWTPTFCSTADLSR